jgi:hypothetical protein
MALPRDAQPTQRLDVPLGAYGFHQTAIIGIAFYLLSWNLGISAKFLVIFAVSLAITVLLYEPARRWIVTRLLFGLKARSSTKPSSASEPSASIGRDPREFSGESMTLLSDSLCKLVPGTGTL